MACVWIVTVDYIKCTSYVFKLSKPSKKTLTPVKSRSLCINHMKAFSVILMLCKHPVLGENCLCTHSCPPGRVMGTNCVLLFFPNVKKAVHGSQRRTPDAVNAKTSWSLRLFWSSILMFGIWKLTIQLYLFARGCVYSNSRMTQSLMNYSLGWIFALL